jgi:GDP-L-fucose synthase
MPTNLYGPNDNYDLENSHVIPALIRKFHLAKLAALGDWEGIKVDEARFGAIPPGIAGNLRAISQDRGHSIRDNMHSRPGSVIDKGNADSALPKPSASTPAVEVWGSGKSRREFLYVDDLASACVFIMALEDGDYHRHTHPMLSHINIGSGKDLTIADLAESVRSVVGFEGAIVFNEDRTDGAPRKLLDISKLTSLGWKPRISLKAGIELTYKSYLDHGK